MDCSQKRWIWLFWHPTKTSLKTPERTILMASLRVRILCELRSGKAQCFMKHFLKFSKWWDEKSHKSAAKKHYFRKIPPFSHNDAPRENPKTSNKTRLCFQTLFIFSPTYLVKWSDLTNIFHMGRFNHQLDMMVLLQTVGMFRKNPPFPTKTHQQKSQKINQQTAKQRLILQVKDFVMMENVGALALRLQKSHFCFFVELSVLKDEMSNVLS